MMDAILHLPPGLPVHHSAPFQKVPCSVVAQWPEGTFVENLVTLDAGWTLVSVLSEARLDRVSPDGEITLLTQFSAPPTGLFIHQGDLYAAVGEPGGGTPDLWKVNVATGDAELWMPLTGMTFANGVTHFGNGTVLFADSWLGQLFLVDVGSKTISVWLEDERLTRAPGIDFLPGANGIKRYGNEVTISSNGRALLLRASVEPDGSAGPLELIADALRVDDFAYDVDGALYLCTHIGHSLDKLTRDGKRVTLAGPEEGLAGSTACAFGRTPTTRSSLFVTTTGGIVTPPDGILQPARLVRLEVDAIGFTGEEQ